MANKKQPASTISQVFDYWRQSLGHPRARLTADRKAAVRRRLAEGYSVDEIKRAIDGCKASPFHQGDNEFGSVYDDLTLICRSGSKLEQFIGYLSRGKNRRHDPGRPPANAPREKYSPPCRTCGGLGVVDSHPSNAGFVPDRTYIDCPDCS